MKGPPRFALLYTEAKEHWLASVDSATEGFIAPALMKVVFPNRPCVAFDWMLDSVTYLLSRNTSVLTFSTRLLSKKTRHWHA